MSPGRGSKPLPMAESRGGHTRARTGDPANAGERSMRSVAVPARLLAPRSPNLVEGAFFEVRLQEVLGNSCVEQLTPVCHSAYAWNMATFGAQSPHPPPRSSRRPDNGSWHASTCACSIKGQTCHTPEDVKLLEGDSADRRLADMATVRRWTENSARHGKGAKTA